MGLKSCRGRLTRQHSMTRRASTSGLAAKNSLRFSAVTPASASEGSAQGLALIHVTRHDRDHAVIFVISMWS